MEALRSTITLFWIPVIWGVGGGILGNGLRNPFLVAVIMVVFGIVGTLAYCLLKNLGGHKDEKERILD